MEPTTSTPISTLGNDDPSLPAIGQNAPAGPGPWPCASDPAVETYLRCGRCEKPICPRCLIQTPVGSRCRQCAQLRRLPMFVLGPLDYLKAIGAALGVSVACGIAVALVLH